MSLLTPRRPEPCSDPPRLCSFFSAHSSVSSLRPLLFFFSSPSSVFFLTPLHVHITLSSCSPYDFHLLLLFLPAAAGRRRRPVAPAAAARRAHILVRGIARSSQLARLAWPLILRLRGIPRSVFFCIPGGSKTVVIHSSSAHFVSFFVSFGSPRAPETCILERGGACTASAG